MNYSKLKILFILVGIGFIFSSCKKDSVAEENKITKDWFYKIGQSNTEKQADNPDILIRPVAGENINWNFSGAVSSSTDVTTVSIVDATGLPSVDLFPDATIARVFSDSEQVNYYDTSKDTLKYLGSYLDQNSFITAEQSYFVIAPFEFGENFYSPRYFSFFFNNTFDELYIVNINVKFSGRGTVVTPTGRFTDCIMLEGTTYDVDEKLTGYFYTFYKDNFNNQVAQYSLTLNEVTDEFDASFSWSE